MSKKKVFVGVGVLLIVCVLAAVFLLRGKGEPLPVIPAPMEYATPELSVTALPVSAEVQVTEKMPKAAQTEEEDAEQDPEAAISVVTTYNYKGMEDIVTAVSEYCELLMGDEFGFVPVDEELKETELPELTDKGTLLLVHPKDDRYNEEDEAQDILSALRLNWTKKGCEVQVCQIPEHLVTLNEKPRPEPLTVTQAIDYLYGFAPNKLGLKGNSMFEYQVLAMDGAVMVNGVPCLQMNVYGKNPNTGTNELEGQYLFSNEDRSLYEIASEGFVEQIVL